MIALAWRLLGRELRSGELRLLFEDELYPFLHLLIPAFGVLIIHRFTPPRPRGQSRTPALILAEGGRTG